MKILLIEDDLDDIELLQEALQAHGVAHEMDIVNDGSAALLYIGSAVAYPDIIILDFNLPKVHGRQVLLGIKSADPFKDIPLVILTTSSAREDMDYAYRNGADKYLIKPTNAVQLKETVEVIVNLVSVEKNPQHGERMHDKP